VSRVLRRVAAAALLVTAVAPVSGAQASGGLPVVGLIDTGVSAGHQEFAPGQLVGFWDFSRDGGTHTPSAGQSFDPAVSPYDPIGHGTLTSSMAVGRNLSAQKTPSFAPGYPFAMAKVLDDGGALVGSIGAAIRWEVDTVGVKVISISIGRLVPVPLEPAVSPDYQAIAYARSKGVLVVVSNGNGLADTGATPSDGAMTGYSESTDVLAVGADTVWGFLNSYNPEVVSTYNVVGASSTDSTGYVSSAGTSFSTPLAAGFAARLVAEAAANGRTLDAARLETLVKDSATDNLAYPPMTEGYGQIDAAALTLGLAHAAAGTLPARPSPDVSGTYVEQVAGAERQANGAVPYLGGS